MLTLPPLDPPAWLVMLTPVDSIHAGLYVLLAALLTIYGATLP